MTKVRPSLSVYSLGDFVAEKFKIGMPAAVQKFGRAIRPIYCAEENGRATHLGTCILVERNHRRFLVTAAHVVDVSRQSQLSIPVQGKLKPILGTGIATTPPARGRRYDRFDFAAIPLDPAFVHDLGEVPYISEGDLQSGDKDTEGRMYVAIGYPNSRNDKNIDHRKLQIRPAPFSYGATVIRDEKLAKKLRVSGNDHLFLRYDKRSRDVDGGITTSIEPQGMSGGALIDMGRVSVETLAVSAPPSALRLAGLLIEIHRIERRMVAVKINTVIEAIDDAIRDGKLNQE